MLRNYLLVAIRQFYKLPVFSAINTIGLVIGLSSSILIGLWVHDELTWDHYHENRENIYRVHLNRRVDNGIDTQAAIPLPLWEEFKDNEPDIEYVAPANWGWMVQLSYNETRVQKLNYFVGADLLKMLTVPIIKGSSTPFVAPSSIIITETTAKDLFGDEDPIGKTIRFGTGEDQLLEVTAVIQDPPTNSSLTYGCIVPFELWMQVDPWVKRSFSNWENNSFNLYVSFREGTDPKIVEERIKDAITRHTPDATTKFEITFLPMTRWHLYNEWENGKSVAGQMNYVRIFGAIGLFILFIACINFTNLSTARSERRAKEVGIRKSVGSGRRQLIVQFLGETFLMALCAFLLSLTVVQAALPAFNLLVGKSLQIDFTSAFFWVASIFIVVLTSLVAGAYPAFYLSAFKPAHVLKGKLNSGSAGFLPRRILVTVQFFFSIILIIATTIAYQQINHLKDRDTGYDRNNLLSVWIQPFTKKYEAFKTEALQKGYAVSVTRCGSPITDVYSWTSDVSWPGKREDQKNYIAIVETDYDYCKTTGMKILEGRDFSPDHVDSLSVILNESAVSYMELEDPIGSTIGEVGTERKFTVVGVVKDVVMQSPEQGPPAIVYGFSQGNISDAIVRLPKGREKESIKGLETLFRQFAPDAVFAFNFVDQQYSRKFAQIERVASLTNIFALLAIFISCLGLFGLAAFTAERRTKEIGVRKVLGASVASLVALLSKEFAILVVVAFAFATPLSWWQANSILSQYSYHVSAQWWVFLAAGAASLFLAVITVGTQAFRAARSNPAESLKTE